MSDVIGDFVRRYVREQDFHDRVAQLVGQTLERILRAQKIRAITSWRGKKPDRLERKLRERELQRVEDGDGPYPDEHAIYEDVPDLAGARVALYFPDDRAIVGDLILAGFEQIRPPKRFPSTDGDHAEKRTARAKRFSGYAATHYRVRLRRDALSVDDARLAEGRCEIQVGSVLMHAWAEVEHDLEYKTLSGPVSEIESVLLDQINGLVMAGEIALEQLSRATKRRSSGGLPGATLRDAYDLANWLASVAGAREDRVPRVDVGPVDFAFQFIEKLGLTKVADLALYADKIRERMDGGAEEEPPAALLLDALREANPERDADLAAARRDVTAAEQGTAPAASPEAPVDAVALGTLLRLWRVLEQLTLELPEGAPRLRGPFNVIETISEFATLDRDQRQRLRELAHLRNRAVHATTNAPTVAEMFDGARQLVAIIRDLPARAIDERARRLMEDAVSTNRNVLEAGGTMAAQPSLDVQAGPAVVLPSRRAVIVPFVALNTSSTPTTLVKVLLDVRGTTYSPSLPVDGLQVTGMPFREVAAGLRLEASDAVRCALYFGPSFDGVAVDVPGNLAKLQLLVDSVRDGSLTLELDVQR